MNRDQVVQAVNALLDAFPWYEPHNYPVGSAAMEAADLLARLEHGDAVLKALGEIVGDVDHHSEATALASGGRRAAHALVEIVSQGVGDAEACGVLDGVKPVAAFGDSRDSDTAYGLVEDVLRDLLEDARLSAAAAYNREVALGDIEKGTVAIDPSGQLDGISVDVLTAPSAQGWCVEFAEDAAKIVEAWTDEPDPDDVSAVASCMRRGVFAGTQIRQAVTHMVIGQGFGAVQNANGAYESAAFAWMDAVNEEGELDILTEQGRYLLIAVRAWVACSTAFAALDDRLGRFLPDHGQTSHDEQEPSDRCAGT